MDLFLEGNGAMKVVRSTERKQLEKLYLENGNRFLLLYGTAYTMKESLLSDFLSDKDYFYYRSRNVSPEEQKRIFLESTGKRFDCDLKPWDRSGRQKESISFWCWMNSSISSARSRRS